MSLLKYLKPKDPVCDSNTHLNDLLGHETLRAMNECVRNTISSSSRADGNVTPGSGRKGSKYATFSPSERAMIGKYCQENGPAATLRKFKSQFDKLSESTVRSFGKKYTAEVRVKKRKLEFSENDTDELEITEMHPKKRGRPLLLGQDLDMKMQEYVKMLRKNGSVINSAIVKSAAKALVMSKDRSLLAEYGGTISLSRYWAKSILLRMNFVKRRASTACKTDIVNFDEKKADFLDRICSAVDEHDIPAELIINWDHAGLNIVPVSNWTMELEGAKRVEIVGHGDKKQITAVFAGNLKGECLY